jgi:hypothetical protein
MIKKTTLTLIFILGNSALADGGALGVQLGGVTFGLGGSSRGPIIGVGPSPCNGRCFSAVIVPGSNCGCCNSCSCTTGNCCGCNSCSCCN